MTTKKKKNIILTLIASLLLIITCIFVYLYIKEQDRKKDEIDINSLTFEKKTNINYGNFILNINSDGTLWFWYNRGEYKLSIPFNQKIKYIYNGEGCDLETSKSLILTENNEVYEFNIMTLENIALNFDDYKNKEQITLIFERRLNNYKISGITLLDEMKPLQCGEQQFYGLTTNNKLLNITTGKEYLKDNPYVDVYTSKQDNTYIGVYRNKNITYWENAQSIVNEKNKKIEIKNIFITNNENDVQVYYLLTNNNELLKFETPSMLDTSDIIAYKHKEEKVRSISESDIDGIITVHITYGNDETEDIVVIQNMFTAN